MTLATHGCATGVGDNAQFVIARINLQDMNNSARTSGTGETLFQGGTADTRPSKPDWHSTWQSIYTAYEINSVRFKFHIENQADANENIVIAWRLFKAEETVPTTHADIDNLPGLRRKLVVSRSNSGPGGTQFVTVAGGAGSKPSSLIDYIEHNDLYENTFADTAQLTATDEVPRIIFFAFKTNCDEITSDKLLVRYRITYNVTMKGLIHTAA